VRARDSSFLRPPLSPQLTIPGSHSSDFSAYSSLSDGHRILSFDYRGHGQSTCTPPYTFAQIVDDIHALRAHFVGDAKAVICGGSFGGYLAQQYAITYPHFVSHLILRGTAPSHERQ
jgi:pimeloyl-ACP methyl ester carboxylesterase